MDRDRDRQMDRDRSTWREKRREIILEMQDTGRGPHLHTEPHIQSVRGTDTQRQIERDVEENAETHTADIEKEGQKDRQESQARRGHRSPSWYKGRNTAGSWHLSAGLAGCSFLGGLPSGWVRILWILVTNPLHVSSLERLLPALKCIVQPRTLLCTPVLHKHDCT